MFLKTYALQMLDVVGIKENLGLFLFFLYLHFFTFHFLQMCV